MQMYGSFEGLISPSIVPCLGSCVDVSGMKYKIWSFTVLRFPMILLLEKQHFLFSES